ncbi:putative hydrolase YxeP [Planctomycetes bacterium Pan216]|uniref:Putative hydrolase YxeP n=1 Tax=Kolteria novifilia TaxID=2527975 RepID=A0A518BBV9_9BACT|nr:putative hydrolase YxeP [Planctomycetes bacterium Pan216]
MGKTLGGLDAEIETIDREVEQHLDLLREVRRYLHMHPEPSGGEFQTTLYIAHQLREHGIDHRVVESERGIIAGQLGASNEPLIAIRADTDALSIIDEKSVPYRSRHDGVMHACGHDAHSTMVLGATLALNALSRGLDRPLPWRAIFQPAEETALGANEMVASGAVDSVGKILALHVDPTFQVGRVGIRRGALTAQCCGVEIEIWGKGGHAARPHDSIDPIVVASQLLSLIYQTVPRRNDSREPVVVTFGMIEGGKNPNVIPERVRLAGTIRTTQRETTERIKNQILAICRGLSEASGAGIDVDFPMGPDAVVNDPDLTDQCEEVIVDLLGPGAAEHIPQPSMGGEDFSAYLREVPGCLMRLGVADGRHRAEPLHSPRFDIDERALALGAKLLARAVVTLAHQDARGATP